MTNKRAGQDNDEDQGRWSEYEDAIERREALYESGSTIFWDLTVLVELWLKELREVGLSALDSASQAPPKQAEVCNPELNSPWGDPRLVHLEKGKVLWLRFDGDRTESLKLMEFLEYGTAKGLPTRMPETAAKCVEAAVLRDVAGLSPKKIAERFGIPEPPNFSIKRDYPQVRDLVGEGRSLLEEALGKDGWRERKKTMKAEMQRWQSLERVMNLGENRIEMRIPRSAWFPHDLRFPHS